MMFRYSILAVSFAALFYYYRTTMHVKFNLKYCQDKIEDMLLTTWNDYSKNGFGFDIYSPISHRSKNMPRTNEPLGWINIDSIDTLMLFYSSTNNSGTKLKLEAEIIKIENWITKDIHYKDIDAEINIFETTIRMLGGLLSAYYLSNEFQVGNSSLYLNKATELADILSLSFGQSPSGIPFSSINLKTGNAIKNHADQGASSTAEFTTLQMEFKYLSAITGNDTYWKLAEQVYKPLYEQNNLLGPRYDGLVPIYTFADSGKFFTSNIRLGSRGDSFYEYLLKQYLLTHEPLYYQLYRQSMEGVKKHLVHYSYPNKWLYIAEKPNGLTGRISPKMDHLVCFMGGLLAMGATEGLHISEARKQTWWDSVREEDWQIAKDLTHTCYQMYHQLPSGLSPEIVVFNGDELEEHETRDWWKAPSGDFYVKPLDAHNLQRPETVESIMILYHLTGNQKYREWGQEIMESFDKNTCVHCDDPSRKFYTSLNNCIEMPTDKRDNLESFWIAETLKYLHLLFQDDVDMTKFVFNTEAHPFPVLDKVVLDSLKLVTGWSL
ncbi:hypothetical protein KAFR_0E04290 [Kazachstania africana CBS 2517]|uniref:alpha-1,2-Mannosidase n=1 Tax=Kazachstania africana (strain ATCC 22294 / BCRC 22015 / CBS 2517 / CECT 1963 / NBRC 1671 / NRRL Y-8276) TaxID=1071382 RepID=H2AW30_KAZAF|nr:hypothetical protein KAFR_0E04290 [Kazachstania africana CBS 2517]CCF58580.1 hypothetical protein KAFR_0E04290 [Kazachstania africana CBS 2517]